MKEPFTTINSGGGQPVPGARQPRACAGVRQARSVVFSPLPLADVMAVLRAREAAGSIRLVKKAPAPAR